MSREEILKLNGCRVLVVEDNYFVADDLRRALVDAGGEVIGPAATVADALECIREEHLHAAILDVNLDGEMSFPIAEELDRRSVPFVFATGYDEWGLPEPWQHARRISKPYQSRLAIGAIVELVQIANGSAQ